jgi:transcription antitermination factor NusG
MFDVPTIESRTKLGWYLVRTKQYKEHYVRERLAHSVAEVFLPLCRSNRSATGPKVQNPIPLFPCYLFVLCDLESDYYRIKYSPGVVRLICTGTEPHEVAPSIVDGIKKRGNPVVDLPRRSWQTGQAVTIVGGPMRGLDAIFERYTSGPERVAILLEAVGATCVRIILPAKQVGARADFEGGRRTLSRLATSSPYRSLW